MKTGGTETFAYDGLHRLQYYSDPYHNNPSNPSITYFYDGLDRISGIVDALNHSTNFDYNDRGQVTVTTLPWINGVRYTISNLYNPDGTLQRRTDELGHFTSYTYDDYRRLKSVTPPVRGYGITAHTPPASITAPTRGMALTITNRPIQTSHILFSPTARRPRPSTTTIGANVDVTVGSEQPMQPPPAMPMTPQEK